MKHKFLASIAVVAIGLAACETPAELSFEAPDAPLTKAEGKAIGKSGSSATGGGHIRFENAYRRMSVTAHKDADGAVSGQFQFKRGGGPIHGAVTCLTVVDNEAYIGGTVTHYPDFPVRVGGDFVFMVRDNGEGKKDPADEISLAYIGVDPDLGWAEEFCGLYGFAFDELNNTIQDIDNGNIQVKGDDGGIIF